jgi:lipid II:glycine glycyltransferase (peptidoglycan interpeptide bridge formation enzyme)
MHSALRYQVLLHENFQECESILDGTGRSTFFQSKTWLTLLAAYGQDPFLVTLINDKKRVVAYYLLYVTKSDYLSDYPRWKPTRFLDRSLIGMHGPVILEHEISREEVLVYFLDFLEQHAKKFRTMEMICSPTGEPVFQTSETFSRTFKIENNQTWILEISDDDKDGPSKMRRDRRRNVKKSEEFGLTFQVCENLDDVQKYVDVRNGAQRHNQLNEIPFSHFEKNWKLTRDDDSYFIFLAKQNNKNLAGQAAFLSGNYLYLTGVAVSPESRSQGIPANDFLQFNIIKWAYLRGIKLIDFVGANPESKNEKLRRIDDAKSSWGSQIVNYPVIRKKPINQNKELFIRILIKLNKYFYKNKHY